MTRADLIQLVRDVERWVGIEPIGDEQWDEAGKVRQRVRELLGQHDRSIGQSQSVVIRTVPGTKAARGSR